MTQQMSDPRIVPVVEFMIVLTIVSPALVMMTVMMVY